MSATTIGDVLNKLRDEFDDITISKIRFLEAEGLIHPDRTDSGYRKFSEDDVERLRYVLRAQRDRYLPLKVIKEELEQLDAEGGLKLQATVGRRSHAGQSAADAALVEHTQSTLISETTDSSRLLSDGELAEAAGLTESEVGVLREHGLLGSGPHGETAARIAGITSQLLAAGLEVRHLRMYRQFADREAALIEQRVAPSLRQRNPDSRRRARESAEELAGLGGQLQRALLSDLLRDLLQQ